MSHLPDQGLTAGVTVLRVNGNALQDVPFQQAKLGLYTELISFAVEKINGITMIKCSIHCASNANCFSMVFDLDRGLCFLLSKGISVDALTKPHLPTNIQAFTKDGIKCSDIGYQESNWQNDRCFKAHFDTKTKPEADKECAKEYGFLVQIDSASKHNAVKQFVQSLPSGNKFFIDGSDKANEDDWRLSDGNLLYLDWKPDEPNRLHVTVEYSMMVAGQTKFDPDWHFGVWKLKWLSFTSETMNDIAYTVRHSSLRGHNIPQVVSDPQTPVQFRDWKSYLPERSKYHSLRK
ncbi:uncharacterized protein LOC134268157 [Saccostrea cucullata]|uniref:uncharacterized protein LOC134268157 n=1 Tax=Saccostrea cuccullata TaxID=36930 RepID=UPI002ECFCFDA